jgi:uncharacterized protein YndB with AHSA1/START domain
VATVSRHIDAPIFRVYEVLSDGWTYAGWVVGTSHIRAVDTHWPAPGARIHHASGNWPIVVRDTTEMKELEPERRLMMVASGRPLGSARIEIRLEPDAIGCTVVLAEVPISGPGAWLHNRLADRVLHARNVETLARLEALALRPTIPAR